MQTVSSREQRITLVAAILGTGIAFLDMTVVNVALPAIRDDLGGGLAGQQWVVNGYLLTLGALLLVCGSLGDVIGHRTVFAIGVGGFGAASLLCAIAPTIELLVAARALQGVTAALLTPASLAVIASTFQGAARGKAIGTWTAWGGITTVVGPFVGGWLLEIGTWRWIFAINVPFVLVTLGLVAAGMPPCGSDGKRRIDFVGGVLAALALGGPVAALIEQPSRGWGDPLVAGGLVAGAVLLAAFLLWESRVRDPMLPLSLFRRRNFSWANVETLFVYGALSAFFFLVIVFLQQTAGWSPLEAGVAAVPVTALIFLLSGRFGELSVRFGPRFFMAGGPLLCALGALLFLGLDEDVAYVSEVLPGMVLFGLGLALTVAPLTTTVMADAGPGSGGIASGVNNAVARVAGLLGVAAVGVAAGGALDVEGFRMGVWLTVALLAVGGLAGLVGIRRYDPGPSPDAEVTA